VSQWNFASDNLSVRRSHHTKVGTKSLSDFQTNEQIFLLQNWVFGVISNMAEEIQEKNLNQTVTGKAWNIPFCGRKPPLTSATLHMDSGFALGSQETLVILS